MAEDTSENCKDCQDMKNAVITLQNIIKKQNERKYALERELAAAHKEIAELKAAPERRGNLATDRLS